MTNTLPPHRKTVSFSKNATNIFFHLLTQCNLNCSHCYINPEQHGKNRLDIDTIKAWLKAFEKKKETSNIIFLGGEPTLHPHLKDAIHFAKDMGFKSITIDTNGYLFHDILSHVTPSEVDFISFSLDGASASTNDPIRGENSFDTCTSGIRKAKEMGFKTSLIYTVSQKNLNDLVNMVPLIKTLAIDHFFIQVIGIRGKSCDPLENSDASPSLQLTKQQWEERIPKVAEAVSDMGIPVTYPKVFLDRDEPFECAGLVAENYFIFPNGRVYTCPLCEDYPLNSFYFKENQLKKMPKINEADLFPLKIPEGCVMNKMIQPHNIDYDEKGEPRVKIACCMLKVHIDKRS